MPKHIPINKRKFLNTNQKKNYKQKLKELTDRFNVPEHMGELFLNEIRLSKSPGDQKFKDAAKLLGLL